MADHLNDSGSDSADRAESTTDDFPLLDAIREIEDCDTPEAREAKLQEIKALIVKETDIDRPDEDGENALYVAVDNEDVEVVRLLLNAGASPDVVIVGDIDDSSILHTSLRHYCDPDICQMLMAASKNVHQITRGTDPGVTTVHAATVHAAAIHAAAVHADSEHLARLIGLQVNLDSPYLHVPMIATLINNIILGISFKAHNMALLIHYIENGISPYQSFYDRTCKKNYDSVFEAILDGSVTVYDNLSFLMSTTSEATLRRLFAEKKFTQSFHQKFQKVDSWGFFPYEYLVMRGLNSLAEQFINAWPVTKNALDNGLVGLKYSLEEADITKTRKKFKRHINRHQHDENFRCETAPYNTEIENLLRRFPSICNHLPPEILDAPNLLPSGINKLKYMHGIPTEILFEHPRFLRYLISRRPSDLIEAFAMLTLPNVDNALSNLRALLFPNDKIMAKPPQWLKQFNDDYKGDKESILVEALVYLADMHLIDKTSGLYEAVAMNLGDYSQLKVVYEECEFPEKRAEALLTQVEAIFADETKFDEHRNFDNMETAQLCIESLCKASDVIEHELILHPSNTHMCGLSTEVEQWFTRVAEYLPTYCDQPFNDLGQNSLHIMILKAPDSLLSTTVRFGNKFETLDNQTLCTAMNQPDVFGLTPWDYLTLIDREDVRADLLKRLEKMPIEEVMPNAEHQPKKEQLVTQLVKNVDKLKFDLKWKVHIEFPELNKIIQVYKRLEAEAEFQTYLDSRKGAEADPQSDNDSTLAHTGDLSDGVPEMLQETPSFIISEDDLKARIASHDKQDSGSENAPSTSKQNKPKRP